MNIDVFSDCVFTHGAFEHLAHQINTDIHIAVFDVSLYINNYHNRISEKKYDFIIILNTRKHPPIALSGEIILLSKLTSLKVMKKFIFSCLCKGFIFRKITLTPRERLFYKYWLEGETTAEISILMNESIKTVSNIKQSIYRKYDTSDRYIFMLIMKISQINGNVDCRHYKLCDDVEIKNHTFKRIKNAQSYGGENAIIPVDFYSSV